MNSQRMNEITNYMDEFRTIKTTETVMTDGLFLKVAKADYTLANKVTITREEIIKKNNDAAVILPITREGKIVLIVQPRPLTKEGVTIEIPAGYIDAGETDIEAAMRELLEETGYMPTDGIISMGEYYQDQGCSRGINSLYLALGCAKIEEQSLDKDEFVKYFECSYDELLELIDMGYIKSANSLLTIKLSEVKTLDYLKTIKGNVKKRG